MCGVVKTGERASHGPGGDIFCPKISKELFSLAAIPIGCCEALANLRKPALTFGRLRQLPQGTVVFWGGMLGHKKDSKIM